MSTVHVYHHDGDHSTPGPSLAQRAIKKVKTEHRNRVLLKEYNTWKKENNARIAQKKQAKLQKRAASKLSFGKLFGKK